MAKNDSTIDKIISVVNGSKDYDAVAEYIHKFQQNIAALLTLDGKALWICVNELSDYMQNMLKISTPNAHKFIMDLWKYNGFFPSLNNTWSLTCLILLQRYGKEILIILWVLH